MIQNSDVTFWVSISSSERDSCSKIARNCYHYRMMTVDRPSRPVSNDQQREDFRRGSPPLWKPNLTTDSSMRIHPLRATLSLLPSPSPLSLSLSLSFFLCPLSFHSVPECSQLRVMGPNRFRSARIHRTNIARICLLLYIYTARFTKVITSDITTNYVRCCRNTTL